MALTLERPLTSVPAQTATGVRLVGGLFVPDLLDQLRTDPTSLDGQRPSDFGFSDDRALRDDIAEAYRDALAWWDVFQRRLARMSKDDRAVSLTREEWVLPLFHRLGYELVRNPRAYELDGQTYAISHRAGENEDAPPVHIAGARQELGRVDPSGRPRLSPHALVQEFLNRSGQLWGIATNGLTLRLLRTSPRLRTETYVEFDLAAIFSGERYGDFVVLYRLLHRTRLPTGLEDAPYCWLEHYHQQGQEQGARARDRLRDGVERALLALGNGFLRHPANETLRQQIAAGELSASRYYELLLRVVYRLLFLLVTEERGLLGGNTIYWQGYSLTRLRRLVEESARDDYDDLWAGLLALFQVLRDSTPQANGQPLAARLDLPVLDGDLFHAEPFEAWRLANRALLDALAGLSLLADEQGTVRRINYAALDVEELGSVYESLLDHAPVLDLAASEPFSFVQGQGLERKSTGSYYTPPELVRELVASSLEPVLAARLRGKKTKDEQEQAILSLKVCDPAAGSGHFLLAAARRLARELARVRTGEQEPAPETVREALRDVIAHCLYAVDKNPLAVELCKVALWIEAHVPGQPLTFLDHRIKCGDSLVGVFDLAVLRDGIPDEAYERDDAAEKAKASSIKRRNRQERAGQLTLTADVVAFDKTLLDLGRLTDHVAQMPERTIAERRAKEQAYQQLQRDPRFRRLRAACDLWTAAFFADLRQSETVPTTDHVRQALADTLHDARLTGAAQALASELRFFHWPLAFPDVFVRGGFDVVLGNPPFMGGLLISGILGPRYRKWLEAAFQPFVGMADLCAAFLRCAFSLLGRGGRMGIVATNTISQGDTRESGLVVILRQHGTITFARRFVRWPGTAKVEVNLVSIQKSDRTTFAADMAVLDGIAVPFISSRLDSDPEVEPKRLALNEGKAFQGDIVRGLGFVLTPKEAERLLTADPRNADCLFPYLNGEDVNSDAEQRPSRYVICFHDWDLERAKQYPALLRIVEERVKPERERLRGPGDQRNREYWWRFGAYRAGMRRAIAPLRRVLLRSRVSELHALVFVPTGWIYSEQTIVFAFDDDYHFALLQSDVHEVWVRKQASSLRTDVRYTPTDCFDTFPFPLEEYKRLGSHEWRLEELPTTFQEAARVGAAYHEHRRQIMAARNLGLTKTYNLFHDPDCTDPDIARLRELHAAMDNAVLACYGWQDIDLHHDFYQNERGQTRFTVSPDARRELLRRLLELNLEVARWERSAGVQG